MRLKKSRSIDSKKIIIVDFTKCQNQIPVKATMVIRKVANEEVSNA